MPVEGFDGYEVSDLGRVRSCVRRFPGDWRILKPTKCTKRYQQVGLWRDRKRFQPLLHQIVAWAFLGPPPDTGQTFDIHHLDGDRANNRPSNLEYVPHREHWRKQWTRRRAA